MTAGPAGVRYSTEVVRVGAMIPEFRASGLLVLFGENAPEELHDVSVLHRPEVVVAAPVPGDVLEIDGARFTVTAVGDVVEANLLRLGHASVKADGSTTAPLPGDVCVEALPLPLPRPGSVIRIVAASVGAGQPTDQIEEPS